ncbi:hypothetical protein [Streptosporangium roseum]|uniref:hypothetical protein n=1 Tax=Streptosporangium roseum TaxID=2001 RepID=UPI003317CA99
MIHSGEVAREAPVANEPILSRKEPDGKRYGVPHASAAGYGVPAKKQARLTPH